MDALRPEEQRAMVGKHFTPVGLHFDEESVFVPISTDVSSEKLEGGFNALWKELGARGHIPMLIKDEGELGVYIVRKPSAKYRSSYVNLAMLFATIATTIFTGMMQWGSYENIDMFSGRALAYGCLFFALPLLLILGVHESAHFLAARRHGVAASLPFFIPSFPPIGTFGAFISMRDPIPNRKALLDIGVSGPIAGFIMTLGVTCVGMYLSNYYHIMPSEDASGVVYLGTPVIFNFLGDLVGYNPYYLLHPTAFAGWVGFLVTSLNLLPAGQLDGGHTARALFGEKTKYAGYASIIILVILALMGYPSWVVFILLIMFLGLHHPPPLNDLSKLDLRRKGLGAFAIIILFIAFIPIPISQLPADYGVEVHPDPITGVSGNVDINASVNYTVILNNTGNVGSNMRLEPRFSDKAWKVNFSHKVIYVPAGGYKEVNVTVHSPPDAWIGNLSDINLTARPEPGGRSGYLHIITTVGFVKVSTPSAFRYASPPASQKGAPEAVFPIRMASMQNFTHSVINVSIVSDRDWYVWPQGNFTVYLENLHPMTFDLLVRPPEGTAFGEMANYSIVAEREDNASRKDVLNITVVMGQLHGVRLVANTSALEMLPGEFRTLQLNITNTGNGADTFLYSVATSPYLAITPSPEGPYIVEAGKTTAVTVVVAAAPDAPPDLLAVRISIFAEAFPPAGETVVAAVNVK